MSLLIFPGTGLDQTPGQTPLACASGTGEFCSVEQVRAADSNSSNQPHSRAEMNQLELWRPSKIPSAQSAGSRLQLPRLAGGAGRSWRLDTWWHPGPPSVHLTSVWLVPEQVTGHSSSESAAWHRHHLRANTTLVFSVNLLYPLHFPPGFSGNIWESKFRTGTFYCAVDIMSPAKSPLPGSLSA